MPRKFLNGIDQDSLSTSGAIIVVNHGSTAGTARPDVDGIVEWIGSVEPTNAINNDIWIETA